MVTKNTLYQGQYYALCTNQDGEEFVVGSNEAIVVALTTGRLDFLGEVREFSKYIAARSFVYLGRDLTPSRLEGDEGYIIEIERVLLATFEDLIAAGRLLDARVIAALSMASSFLQRQTF